MEEKEAFKALLSKHISPWLCDRGFKRKNRRFVKWIDRNCQVISFRKAKWSVVEGYEFLADLGILSERIWNFYIKTKKWLPYDGVLPRFPDPEDCHWRTSIQEPFLIPAYFNKSWVIRDESEIPLLAEEIEDVLVRHAIPALDKYVSDEALRDLWLQTPKFATADILHLTYLAVLLNEIGPSSELPAVLAKLKAIGMDEPGIKAIVAALE